MFTISFPGGVRVDASVNGHIVHTDQPAPLGSGSAMTPFELLFASIGTCMGFYALRFCQQRNIPPDGLRLTLAPISDEMGKHVDSVQVTLEVPAHFPQKYVDAIRHAIDHCSVKRHLAEPPQFELAVRRSAA
jgi:putative redox protein